MVMEDLHEGLVSSDSTGSDVVDVMGSDVTGSDAVDVSCGSTEGGMDGILRRLGASGSSGSGVVDASGGSVSLGFGARVDDVSTAVVPEDAELVSEDVDSSGGVSVEDSSEVSPSEVSGSGSRLGSGGISALLAERSREVRGDLGTVSVRSVSSMIASRGGSSTARSVGSVLRERVSGGLRGRGCGTKVIG